MPKVTYIFGAGASAKCLPIVSGIPNRLENFATFIDQNRTGGEKKFTDLPCDISVTNAEDLFIEACRDLADQCRKHASIDTYAKKLFITNNGPKSNSLKALLTCFFIYEQAKNPTDPRYDAFFASILGTHYGEFKGDINILSWNYDYQFELAYSQYSQKNTLEENQRMLQVLTGSWQTKGMDSRFFIYKTNGTTEYRLPNTNHRHHLIPEIGRAHV